MVTILFTCTKCNEDRPVKELVTDSDIKPILKNKSCLRCFYIDRLEEEKINGFIDSVKMIQERINQIDRERRNHDV